MSTATATASSSIIEEKRHVGMGIFFLVVAVAIIGFFALNTTPEMTTTFGLNPGAKTNAPRLEDWVLPTRSTLWLLAIVSAFFGGWQLAKGFKRVYLALLVVVLMFIFAFLTWAARGTSMNLLGMISASLLRATPIAFGALSGIMCERAGVINIAIEGMMLSGAMVAVVVASIFRNYDAVNAVTQAPLFPGWIVSIGQTLDKVNISEAMPWYLLLGLFAGMLTGGILAAFHAWLSITFKVDQIVSGTVINIFSVGITSFMSQRFLQPIPALNSGGTFKTMPVPLLSHIPIIGPLLFENRLIIYILFVLVIAIHIMLFYTRWGLRTIAVGEHPEAADTLGINVFKMRYINVIIGGLIAGIGGAYFTIGSVGRFDEVLTAGKGFIGLAAMIFGKWTPLGAFGASLIFGFADALQVKMQGLGIQQVPIPSEFLLMAPYIVTMVVLAGVIGQAIPPAADGKPYEKD
ncbi:MAG: ABC transporter permease [Chloroflexi bacterium]|nr:MAG: ABC transporter permease [Chloroflexota bacterium]